MRPRCYAPAQVDFLPAEALDDEQIAERRARAEEVLKVGGQGVGRRVGRWAGGRAWGWVGG